MDRNRNITNFPWHGTKKNYKKNLLLFDDPSSNRLREGTLQPGGRYCKTVEVKVRGMSSS